VTIALFTLNSQTYSMLVYNITYAVSHEIHEEWMTWMKGIHIPEVMSTGLFSSFKVLRLLEVDEQEGLTFAVQFHADTEEQYRRYIAEHAPALRLAATRQWGDQVMGFRTLMAIVQ
jgi:hypothetical protein